MTPPITRILPGRPSIAFLLGELTRSSSVGYYLVVRDLKIRYRQTALGLIWVVLQPLALAAVLALFLGRFADVPADGFPYALFALVGLAGWTSLASGVDASTSSLVGNVNLVTKVYVPRLLIPLASVGSHVIDLLVATAVAIVYASMEGYTPEVRTLMVVPALAWLVLVAASLGSLLSALNVRYRDIRQLMRFLTQLWLFLTPVAYPWTLVPERWRWLYAANPAVGPIATLRWAVLGGPAPEAPMVLSSLASTVLVTWVALIVFRRMDAEFADAI